jgi:hypothetical protein
MTGFLRLTVDKIDISNKIKKVTRVKLATRSANLIPVRYCGPLEAISIASASSCLVAVPASLVVWTVIEVVDGVDAILLLEAMEPWNGKGKESKVRTE